MVNTASLFSQLLREVPRGEFASLVDKHQAERNAKGFTCWTQFTAMLFSQLAHADSLREICNGLACCLGRLVHLGVARRPTKSNLSYANAHRPAALFEDLFWSMMQRFREQGRLERRRHKFRFKNKLLSLDSTTISLCLNLFPWAEFRRAKGGVKGHVLLDHDDYMPSCVMMSKAKLHDSRIFPGLKIRSFVGTSENAIRIQIWTALIALLLLKWLHHLSKAGWSLSNLASMLRLNLFSYRALRDWLDDPFNTTPLQPFPQQLDLNFR